MTLKLPVLLKVMLPAACRPSVEDAAAVDPAVHVNVAGPYTVKVLMRVWMPPTVKLFPLSMAHVCGAPNGDGHIERGGFVERDAVASDGQRSHCSRD